MEYSFCFYKLREMEWKKTNKEQNESIQQLRKNVNALESKVLELQHHIKNNQQGMLKVKTQKKEGGGYYVGWSY